MHNLQIIVLLMTIAIILVSVALRWRIAYPIMLVLGGSILGFIPGINEVDFDPMVVLVLVLPPILYYASYSIPLKEFKKNIQAILGLALGLVIVTTLVLGLLFKWLFPELPWALAFTFGAIISPPDAIAATAILKRFNISTRLLAVLEGESLINDATGLVLYKIGLVALLTGTFSFGEASFEFVKVAMGGVVCGIITGFALHAFASRLFDPVIGVVFSFTIPYITFFLADALHVSGVLAVVVNGLIGSRMLATRFSAITRVVGWTSWDILIILFNCFVFILIGLQLRGVVHRLPWQTILLYLGYGIVLTTATILVRFLWVFLRKKIASISIKHRDPHSHHYHDEVILGWSGMRGIVSSTAALAIPFYLPDGSPLPGRDVVIFLTFVIIFLTLLLPGLSLPWLMKKLKVKDTADEFDTTPIRLKLLNAAENEIKRLHSAKHLQEQEANFFLNYFKARHQVLEITSKSKSSSQNLESTRLQVLQKKRAHLLEIWEKNEISDHLFTLLERELDLEEVYMARAEI